VRRREDRRFFLPDCRQLVDREKAAIVDLFRRRPKRREAIDLLAEERVERDITPPPAAAAVAAPARAELPLCTPEKFEENAAAWRDMVLSGKKTPAALISMLSTKAVLTEEQKLTIDSWAHENE